MSNVNTDLTTAKLIALDLEAAKQFFGHREDAARLEFVKAQASQRALDLSKTWRALQTCLGDQPPLSMCLVGSRSMQSSGPDIVSLLRPDMVPAVSDALEQSDSDVFRVRYDNLEEPLRATATAEQVLESLEQLKAYFREAASERSAVVFAAWT